ncbi:TFIIF subunit [Cavenderia fasciculata]|uniref:TFIIF subunit n=1 Tax=Cavenderia fasciculata TaxID=261658 RepID=F4PN87_CACFS|nr:TFIIF subunit [Cavenderia fasciculata]EGG22940.1 TFIIF subunit [Cavenderia fasciculata]|eukprot:XP_004360791.1 TFIIF subunit [Cavenderia fasciculata]
MSEDSNDALVDELNTDNAENQAWLVKVPKFLVDHWMSRGADAEIGKLYFKSSNLSLTISGTTNENEEFQLATTPVIESNPLKIFSEDKENALALEGSVGLKCDIRMNVDSKGYRELCRGRSESYNTKTRQSKTLEGHQTSIFKNHNPIKPTVSTLAAVMKTKKQEDKRERMAEDELVDLLFHLFEEKTYWDLKSLISRTEQPQAWLKQVLERICILNKRGPHRNYYEIKSEYKNNSKQSDLKD